MSIWKPLFGVQKKSPTGRGKHCKGRKIQKLALKESNNGIQKRRTGEKENNSMKNCCI
jgi:hypothetical protein